VGKNPFVEDLLLVGDELAHPVGDLHRAALEFQHDDGDAVQVENKVGPAFVAASQRHLLGEGKVVVLRVFPIHQMDLLVGPACGDLHRDAVAEELVGAQVGLIQRDSRGIGGGQQLLQGGGNVCVGIAPFAQVRTEQVRLNAAVVRARMPVAKVVIAEAIGAALIGEQGHHPLLGVAFGAGAIRHRGVD